MIGPISVVLVILIFSYISSLTTRKPKKRRERLDTGILSSIMITFVLLPSSCLIVFQCFSCDSDTNTLIADPLIICDTGADDDYSTVRLIGLLGILIWPIGVPLTYLYLLWSHYGPSYAEFLSQVKHVFSGRALIEHKHSADSRRRGLESDVVESHIRSDLEEEQSEQIRLHNLERTAPRYLHALNEEFEPQWWWVPVFEQYRKLGITGATIMYGQGDVDQLILGILIAMFSALLYFASAPYKDFNDDLFSMFTHFQIFLVLLWSLLVKFQKLLETAAKDTEYESSDFLSRDTLGWLLVASNVSIVLAFFAFMVLEIKSVSGSVRARKRWDRIKKDSESVMDIIGEDGSIDEDGLITSLGGRISRKDRVSIVKKFQDRVTEIKRESAQKSGKNGTGDAIPEEDDDCGIEMQENPMKKNTAYKINNNNNNNDGQEIRPASDGSLVELGGQVVSKHTKYQKRSKQQTHSGKDDKKQQDPRLIQLSRGGYNKSPPPGSKKSPKGLPPQQHDYQKRHPQQHPQQHPPPSSNDSSTWTPVLDPTTGVYYYHNSATGESQWTEPAAG